MHWIIFIVAIAGFLLYKRYGPKAKGLLGMSDDLDTTFFGKTVVLQGASGICGVRSPQSPVVDCQSSAAVTDRQLFDMEKTANCTTRPDGRTECQFAIRNKASGMYCSDDGNKLICNRNAPGAWEKFAFIKHPELRQFSFPGAKSGSARKACTDKGPGGIVCDGSKEAFGTNERFSWKLPDEIGQPSSSSSSTPLAPASASTPSLAEGDSVTCNDGTGMVYRYTEGMLRYYPSPAIAASWNPQWAANVKTLSATQCANIPRGDPMPNNVQPSSASMPSPATSTPSADELNNTFFNQTVVITGPAADHTRYCGVKSLGDPSIECEDTEVFDNHQFDVRKTGECKPLAAGGVECQFAFKNKLTGMYCADEGNRIVCNRDQIGPWEKYAFIKHPEGRDFSFPGPKSGSARKACSDKASNIVCDGGKDDYRSPNTRFRWKLLSEISGVKKGDNGPVDVDATTTADTTADVALTDSPTDAEISADMAIGPLMGGGVAQPIAFAIVAVLGIGLLRVLTTPRASVC
jgi:hypothetical protein